MKFKTNVNRVMEFETITTAGLRDGMEVWYYTIAPGVSGRKMMHGPFTVGGGSKVELINGGGVAIPLDKFGDAVTLCVDASMVQQLEPVVVLGSYSDMSKKDIEEASIQVLQKAIALFPEDTCFVFTTHNHGIATTTSVGED